MKLRYQQLKSGWKKILKVMFKNFYTQLCAAALLFCVATSDIQAAPLNSINNKSGKEELRQLPDTSFLIKEVIVSSGVKRRNVSPLRLVDIDEKTIAVQAAGKTYPELLKDIPGIYATAETGSYGDAKINIRGFKQENISVLLNGIPISGLTSGSMYWNNWLGLTDATATIQVQKGVGGSMLSDNSVGGSINIITKSAGKTPQYGVGYNYASGGTSKAFINYNSGELGKGWGISLMLSRVWGTSWVECTDVNAWSYLASVSKKLNSKHSLLFTAMGSPEQHNQRSARLTYDEVQKYGREYSKNWGYITLPDGTREARSISRNNYHKPYFTLNHYYNSEVGASGRKFSMNNAIYMALAHGGGYWTETKGRSIAAHQKDGHVDWDGVVAENRAAYEDGRSVEASSAQNILSDYIAGHTQLGAKSTFELELSDKFTWGAGAHYQSYFTWEKEQITDLLGGDYWYEDYASKSLAGEAGRNPIKRVGDYIRTLNGKDTHFGTLYTSMAFKDKAWNVEFGASLNGSTTRRWDKYNYITDIYSDWATGIGGAVKAGALYRIGAGDKDARSATSIYMNGAYYSRVPYSSVFFASGNNQISEGVKNEQNYLGEAGFRSIFDRVGIEATFYASYWKNKSIMSSPYKPLEEEAYKFMITGLDAFHFGVEVDAYYNFTRWGKLQVYASIGKWEWKNDVSATIYDNYTGQVAQTINVYSNGLPVGDAPQTQIGATLMLKPLASLSSYSMADPTGAISYAKSGELTMQIGWNYNARYWADFEPNTRTSADDRTEPYRIPNYHLVNIGINYQRHFIVGNKAVGANIFFNLNNLFDEWYIERGKDGADHTIKTFTGYWGQGRNCNFGVRFTL